jgi:PEP-CTERM motif-containing protein
MGGPRNEEKTMSSRTNTAFLVVGCLVVAGAVGAAPIGFQNISNPGSTNAGIGEAQLSLDGVDFGTDLILLSLRNDGPNACSITDVYFDNGGSSSCFDSIVQLWDVDDYLLLLQGDTGVDFSLGANPPDLPGGGLFGFGATAGFTADSDSPTEANGVNPGEVLGIVIQLVPNKTWSDVLAAFESGTMRAGIHVQSFPDGGSEAFITNGEIPEPTTMALLGAGVLSLAMRSRRRR